MNYGRKLWTISNSWELKYPEKYNSNYSKGFLFGDYRPTAETSVK